MQCHVTTAHQWPLRHRALAQQRISLLLLLPKKMESPPLLLMLPMLLLPLLRRGLRSKPA